MTDIQDDIPAKQRREIVAGFFFGSPWRILGWGCLAILLYYGLEHSVHPNAGSIVAIILEALRDLGIALVVVFGVSMAVEIRAAEAREKYLRLATTRTLDSYFDRELPDGWFEYLKGEIKKSEFIRSGLVVTISLKESPSAFQKVSGGDDYLLLEQEIKYDVKNITGRPAKHFVRVYIEKPVEMGLDGFVRCLDFEIDGKPLTPVEIQEADEAWNGERFFVKFEKAVDIAREGTLSVFTRCQTVKHKRDHFIWTSVAPSSDIETVCKPCDSIKAYMSLLHPYLLAEDPKVAEDGRSVSTKVTAPVMPSTTVEFSWVPVS